MFPNLRRSRASITPALFAAGAAGLLAVTACSGGGGSSSAGASGSASAAASAAGAASAAAAQPPGAAPSGAAPSWAAALGSSVTVVPPGSPAPGHGSPGAVVAGVLQALNDKNASAYCSYTPPSAQAQCKSLFAQLPASGYPSAKNAAVGYAAIKGNQAVVGITGTVCQTAGSQCSTNTDPAAVFSTVHSFPALWHNAVTPSGSKYSLTPVVKAGGKWYVSS